MVVYVIELQLACLIHLFTYQPMILLHCLACRHYVAVYASLV